MGSENKGGVTVVVQHEGKMTLNWRSRKQRQKWEHRSIEFSQRCIDILRRVKKPGRMAHHFHDSAGIINAYRIEPESFG